MLFIQAPLLAQLRFQLLDALLRNLLHAWCDEAGLCLGQYKTPVRAHEITASLDLLALPDVQGCLLTMDAIGC